MQCTLIGCIYAYHLHFTAPLSSCYFPDGALACGTRSPVLSILPLLLGPESQICTRLLATRSSQRPGMRCLWDVAVAWKSEALLCRFHLYIDATASSKGWANADGSRACELWAPPRASGSHHHHHLVLRRVLGFSRCRYPAIPMCGGLHLFQPLRQLPCQRVAQHSSFCGVSITSLFGVCWNKPSPVWSFAALPAPRCTMRRVRATRRA